MSDKYQKQPVDPKRTPAKSVTWVRNLDKIQKNQRRVVVVPKPALVPKRSK